MYTHSMATITGAALWATGVGLAIAAVFVRLPLDVADLPGILVGFGSGAAAYGAGGQVDRAYRLGWQGCWRHGGVHLVSRPGRNIK